MRTISQNERAIKRYLRRVRKRLSHLEPSEREEILRDLGNHIQEELAVRSAAHPTRSDVAAVLANMEAPESFGREAPPSAKQYSPRERTMGSLALIALLSGLGVFLLGLLLGTLVDDAWLRGGVIVTLILSASALILGIMSWRHPFGKGAAVTAVIVIAIASFLFPAGRTSSEQGPHEPIVEQHSTNSSP